MLNDKPFSPSCDRNRDPILAVLREHFAVHRHVLEIGSGTGQHAVHFAAAMPWLTWQCSDVADNLPGIRMWLDEAALPNTPAPIALDVRSAWPAQRFDAVFSANTLHIMGWAEVEAFFAGVDRVLEYASGDAHPSSAPVSSTGQALRAPRSAPPPALDARALSRARTNGASAARHRPTRGEGRASPSPLVGEGQLRAAKQGEGSRGGALAIYGPFNYGGDYTSASNREFDGWLQVRDPRSGIRDFEAVDALARGIGLHLIADVAMPANNRTLVWRRGITAG